MSDIKNKSLKKFIWHDYKSLTYNEKYVSVVKKDMLIVIKIYVMRVKGK